MSTTVEDPMSADEPVRLRLHRRLSELLDSELADAMMESMPPMPWDQLATKDDIARLDAKTDRLEDAMTNGFGRLDAATAAQGERLEGMIHAQGERLENRIVAESRALAGELALLEGRLSVRYVESTRMIVFAMMTLFVGVVAVMVTTLP